VAALLRDRRLRQGSAEPLATQGITEGLLADWMRMSLLTQEGEPHARLRRLVSQAFTPHAVDGLRPTM
jgi:cytochrome P450